MSLAESTTAPTHPAADLFPMMSGDEFRALMKSIKEHGLQEPIVMHEGKILDGRNRWRACEILGVAPKFVEWDHEEACGSPEEFVAAKNLHRRHLSTQARALIAAQLVERLAPAAKERQGTRTDLSADLRGSPEMGKASEKAAKIMKVSPRTVENALRVVRHGEPELVEAVKAGDLSVSAAAAATRSDGEKIARLGLTRDPAFMYFVRKNGDVVKMQLEGDQRRAEIVVESGVNQDAGYVYFLDRDGDIARAKRKAPGSPRTTRKTKSSEPFHLLTAAGELKSKIWRIVGAWPAEAMRAAPKALREVADEIGSYTGSEGVANGVIETHGDEDAQTDSDKAKKLVKKVRDQLLRFLRDYPQTFDVIEGGINDLGRGGDDEWQEAMERSEELAEQKERKINLTVTREEPETAEPSSEPMRKAGRPKGSKNKPKAIPVSETA